MTFETKKAYTEMYVLLQYLPDEYVKKIPKRIIELFQTEKLENYEVTINKKNPLDKDFLSKKTMVLITILNYQYWCPNKKVKDDLYNMYLSNNKKYQREMEEKYNIDKLFKNIKKEELSIKEPTKALIEYKKRNFMQRLFDKIKNILKRT